MSFVAAALDRAEVNGFANYLTSHPSYRAGVYAAPSLWSSIFGMAAINANIPNTCEWPYNAVTSSLAHAANGSCLSGTSTCAQFFGGQTSASNFAVASQWSGGDGVRNGIGDFDVFDANRTP